MTDAFPPHTSFPVLDDFHKSDWPFYWIVRISSVYTQVMENALKPIGLDMPGWRVLMSLHEGGPLSISQIAEFCVIRLNTTTKIIKRMDGAGLVERFPSPADGRVTQVRITAQGEAARARAWAEAERIFALSFDVIPPARMAEMNVSFSEVMRRLRALRDGSKGGGPD